jgi:NAD(P)-dependent dehydrogenase (short-subunit alcohol dehydrogenase family)
MTLSSRKTAIVTGAGSGIGRGVAQGLLADGWQVGLIGRRESTLAETANGHPDALVLPCDTGQPEAVREAFDRFVERFGRLDLLFNNAGTGTPQVPLETLDPAVWLGCVNVNLNGTFFCTQNAFRIMKAQDPKGGRIINNGSISATTPRPNNSPYTATKHAITGLTKACALDGRAHDIAVGQIDIGNADTEMARPMANGIIQPHGGVMVEPRIDVADVVDAVRYMAGLPLSSNVLFLTVMATKQPFVGRG